MGKFLKPLLIGELAPEEPSLDRGKSVSGTCNINEGGMGLDDRGESTFSPEPHCQGCGRRVSEAVQEEALKN